MKHKVQISIDEALRSLGDAARDCHDLSLDAGNQFKEQWQSTNDQLLAAVTMVVGIRHVVTDIIDKQLPTDKKRHKKQRKVAMCDKSNCKIDKAVE